MLTAPSPAQAICRRGRRPEQLQRSLPIGRFTFKDQSPMINLEDFEDFESQTDSNRPRRIKANHKPKLSPWQVAASLEERDALGQNRLRFSSAFEGIKEEKAWIAENLTQFYHGRLITEVSRRVKGGKEANVYCCLAYPASGYDLLAAKLYRPRKFRSLKNTTQYQ